MELLLTCDGTWNKSHLLIIILQKKNSVKTRAVGFCKDGFEKRVDFLMIMKDFCDA